MNHAKAYKLFLLSASILAVGSLALLSGCKNNTSAATLEKTIGPPPKLDIAPLAVNAPIANPLKDDAWQTAQWYLLIAPSNTLHTTPPTRAAMLYDENNLYVAFVSDKSAAPISRDVVSIFLDSSAALDGTEIVKVEITPTGKTACDWIRSSVTADVRQAAAHENGVPDTTHPISDISNLPVKGLTAATESSSAVNDTVWTTVVTIPLQSLPLPLRSVGSPGTKWKINLLRSIITADTGTGSERLQSNLSPVYLAEQARCPYRMAEITLTGPTPQRTADAGAALPGHI